MFRRVQKWSIEFRCGCTSTETIPSSGLPNEFTTPEMTNKIHDIVLNDLKVNMRKIAEIISISTERVVNTLHTHLWMRKLYARWVPRFPTIDQKRIHVTISKKNLAGKKSTGNVMASVLWDAHGIIFIDYLEKGRTINGAYYAAILDWLVDEIRKKRPHLKKEQILFHDDNAPSHISNIAQSKKHELGFKSLPHPPYSPDLAPSDYLFLNLKRWLCNRRFESSEEV